MGEKTLFRTFCSPSRFGERVVGTLENAFYRHGMRVALHPWRFIFLSLITSLLLSLGLFCFHNERRPFRLWLPQQSDFVRTHRWMVANFPRQFIAEHALAVADNVLEPRVLQQMAEVRRRVTAESQTARASWSQVCARLPATVRSKRHTAAGGGATPAVVASTGEGDAAGTVDLPTTAHFDISERVPRQIPRLDFNTTSWWQDSASAAAALLPSSLYCALSTALPLACWESSLLELWSFDTDQVSHLTRPAVLAVVNSAAVSPVFGYRVAPDHWLGGVERNATGHVISARAALFTWLVRQNVSRDNASDTASAAAVQVTDIGTGEQLDASTLEFESHFLRTMASADDAGAPSGVHWYYSAASSFGTISGAAVWGDVPRLVLGYAVMFVFIELTLADRCDMVHHRVLLSVAGVVSVVLAIAAAVGVSSVLGFSYSPVHNILPLLLLGLGVDDMFVIVQSWRPGQSVQSDRVLSEGGGVGRTSGAGGAQQAVAREMAATMRRAGVSITVTSGTDLAAFLVGASTTLPALRSFCVFAAVGVLLVYLLQVSWLVAWFSLDIKRVAAGRDGLLPCVRHRRRSPSQNCSQHSTTGGGGGLWLELWFRRWYTPCLLSRAGQVTVLLLWLALVAVSGVGVWRLERGFEPLRFLPRDSYLARYHDQLQQHFPDRGADGVVFVSGFDLATNLTRVRQLTTALINDPSIEYVDSWYTSFAVYAKSRGHEPAERPLVPETFSQLLSQFLFSASGAKYRHHFRFDGALQCGRRAPRVLSFMLTYSHRALAAEDRVAAMQRVKLAASSVALPGTVVAPLSPAYAAWETDLVIGTELVQNLAASLAAVLAVSWLLLASSVLGCAIVATSVVLTLTHTAGVMYWSGLTVDTVSCIDLVLGVGLCVDYTAHVVHAYLDQVRQTSGRREAECAVTNALNQIGPAVLCGGASTFLAFVFLAGSESHVFDTFFCVLVTVNIVGLFYGLAVVPVLLKSLTHASLTVGDPDTTQPTDTSSPATSL